MTPQELKRIGRRLYGQDWQSPLARALEKHRVTIWKWAKGIHPISRSDAIAIRELER